MQTTSHILIWSIIFSCCTCTDEAPQKSILNFTQRIDTLFSDYDHNHPGGAIGIVHEGKVILEKYYGTANLESETMFSEKSITDIGSISKQFTACLIALLEESRKLSIDHDIRRYLPEFPIYQDTIRIKHLLFHTSGIKDYEALVLLQGKHYFDNFMSNEYVIDLLNKQVSLNFLPGTQFEYSNSNYILLAEIIERVSKQSLNNFAQEQIFIPLKMNHTFFHIDQGEDFESKAIGYTQEDNRFQRPVYRSHLIGDGGLYTTLSDMIKWDQNFYYNQLGKADQALLDRLKYREKLANGHMNHMSFAQIHSGHPFGQESWSHGGSGGGYRSFYIRFEEAAFSVVILNNGEHNNAFEQANTIVNSFFQYHPDQITDNDAQAENQEAINNEVIPSSKAINNFPGYYYDAKDMSLLAIEYLKETKQFMVKWLNDSADRYPSLALSSNKLVEQADTNYQYHFDPQRQEVIHYYQEKEEKRWKKLHTAKTTIEQFAGTYYAEEINSQLELNIVDNRLFSDNLFFNDLIRIGETYFWNQSTSAYLNFEINPDKKIIGFQINIPRGDRKLRNLQFIKK